MRSALTSASSRRHVEGGLQLKDSILDASRGHQMRARPVRAEGPLLIAAASRIRLALPLAQLKHAARAAAKSCGEGLIKQHVRARHHGAGGRPSRRQAQAMLLTVQLGRKPARGVERRTRKRLLEGVLDELAVAVGIQQQCLAVQRASLHGAVVVCDHVVGVAGGVCWGEGAHRAARHAWRWQRLERACDRQQSCHSDEYTHRGVHVEEV